MDLQKCEVCKDLELEKFTLFGNNKILDIPRADLFDNSQRGCEMCEIIANAIEKSRQPVPSILDRYMPAVRALKSDNGSMSISYLTTSLHEDMSSRCYIYTVAGSSASQKWPHIDSRPSIDQNAVSEGTLGRAASWLKHCIENHPDCGAVEEVELPTRLIKLGDSGGNPQLVITCGMRGKYATLSHCWGSPGSPRPLTTTGPTLDARMAGVSFNDLPRTFQDAIAVTRGLGLNYLWIDSLCIIQESREDWTKESQEMQNVYANAVFNISADSASDSSMGLGRTGDLNLTITSSPISRCGGVQAKIWKSRDLDSDLLSHQPPYPQSPIHHELQSRAWVFQERLLSRRILHFCHYELVWECDTHVTCECFPERSGQRIRKIPEIYSGETSQSYMTRRWAEILRSYSPMSLTIESDRPNAIAGLAMRASKQLSMTYTSGLWTEQLPHCLLWYKLFPGRRISLCTSWSWLSLSGEVLLWIKDPHSKDRPICDSEFVVGGGALEGGTIRVKGRVAAITFDGHDNIFSQTPEGKPFFLEGSLHPDAQDWKELTDAQYYLLKITESQSQSFNRHCCLVLRALTTSTGRNVLPTSVNGIHFQRVGYFDLSVSGWQDHREVDSTFHEASIVLV